MRHVIATFSLALVSINAYAIEFDIPPAPGQKRIQISIPAAPPAKLNSTGQLVPALKRAPVMEQNTKPPKVMSIIRPKNKEPKYMVKEIARAKSDNCKPTSIAMTFQNIPTQKGPYINRWVSLGCEADEVNFVREGNENYVMAWRLAYIPEDKTLKTSPRYFLKWTITGTNENGNNVDWETQHTFSLNSPKTLSLTNNIAVTLRKVP